MIALMSKKEQVKTTLDFLKTGLFALLAALFGIIAFLVVNYKSLDALQAIFSGIGIVVILVAFYLLTRYTLKNLNELGEME